MTDSAPDDLTRVDELIGHILAASPRSTRAHYNKGQLLRARGRSLEAILEYERVLAVNPNDNDTLHALGWCKLITGSIEEVIPLEEPAIRLSPRDPHIGFKYARIGLVHLLQSRTENAIQWLEKAVSSEPEFAMAHAWLAAACALNGETERATTELATARRLGNASFYSSIARLQGWLMWSAGAPEIRALCEATLFAGLRKAGVPEK
jgi:tetratricopeptide (TPR) repeat protein